jgi:hypothetical protein
MKTSRDLIRNNTDVKKEDKYATERKVRRKKYKVNEGAQVQED